MSNPAPTFEAKWEEFCDGILRDISPEERWQLRLAFDAGLCTMMGLVIDIAQPENEPTIQKAMLLRLVEEMQGRAEELEAIYRRQPL